MQAIKDLDTKNSKARQSKHTLEAKKQEQEKLEGELSEANSLVVSHTKALEPFIAEQHALNSYAEKLVERSQLDKHRDTIQQYLKQSALAESDIETKTEALAAAKQHTLLTELSWHNGQAAILAQQLEASQPCLVCGSKEHPKPAKVNDKDGFITKGQVDKARELEGKALETCQAAKDVLSSLHNQLELIHAKTSGLEQRLGHYAELDLENLKLEQKSAQIRIDELMAIKQKKEKLEQRIFQIHKTQDENQRVLSSLETQSNNDNTAALEANITVEQLKQQIPEHYRQTASLEQSLQECVSKIHKLTQSLQKAEVYLKTTQTAYDQATSTEQALLKQIVDIEILSAAAGSSWDEALEQSDFETLEQFLGVQLDDANRATLRTEVDQYRSELDSLKGAVSQLKEELAEKKRPDLMLISTILEQSSLQLKETDNAWRELEARSKNLISVQQKLKKAHLESATLNKQYDVIGTLNDVANGNTGNKISLQRFVLSVLLDDVLIMASERLSIMSKGRYQLVRKEDRAKGNKASGLELEVEDGDTGKPRSVATLSGGESFMAALSLALGLSDVVQSYAGGIKLDTLFIDEGFGSLDMESLDAAIRVLIDLQASGRMIGIISHVTELKEQMANRIDVISSRTGSTIKTIAAGNGTIMWPLVDTIMWPSALI